MVVVSVVYRVWAFRLSLLPIWQQVEILVWWLCMRLSLPSPVRRADMCGRVRLATVVSLVMASLLCLSSVSRCMCAGLESMWRKVE